MKTNSWVGVKVMELMKFEAIWVEVEWSWSSARINYSIQLILQWHCLTLHLIIFKSDLKYIRNWSNLIEVINLIWLILNDIDFYLIESDLSGWIVLFYWILTMNEVNRVLLIRNDYIAKLENLLNLTNKILPQFILERMKLKT